MSKLKDVICYGIAAVLGLLTYAWYALAVTTTKMGTITISQSVWKTMGENGTGLGKTSIIFAVISLVLATLLAIACVIGILNHYGKVKANWISWVAIGLAAAFVVASVLAMALMIAYISDLGMSSISSVGAGLIIPVVCSVLALVAAGLTKLKLGK